MNIFAPQPQKIIWFDLETSYEYPDYEEFEQKDPHGASIFKKIVVQRLWDKGQMKDLSVGEIYKRKSPLIHEFSRITCGALSVFKDDEIHSKSYGEMDNELETVKSILEALQKFTEKGYFIGGHNVIDFDIPLLIKRAIRHNLEIPDILKKNLFAKPWEKHVVDTKRIWKMECFDSYTSLGIIDWFLDSPYRPKDYKVSMEHAPSAYWADEITDPSEKEESRTENFRILKEYCECDTKSTAFVYNKMFEFFL